MPTTLNMWGVCSTAARTASYMKFPATLSLNSTDTARARKGRARLRDRLGRSIIIRPGEIATLIRPKVFSQDADGRLRTRSILPLRRALADLRASCGQAMSGPVMGRPSKVDDPVSVSREVRLVPVRVERCAQPTRRPSPPASGHFPEPGPSGAASRSRDSPAVAPGPCRTRPERTGGFSRDAREARTRPDGLRESSDRFGIQCQQLKKSGVWQPADIIDENI
jgi:hypothetical protein